MKQTTIVAIVLGVLVLISVVQAFQLESVKTKIEGGSVVSSSGGTAPSASSDSGRTAALPKSVQNLPQMVGGC